MFNSLYDELELVQTWISPCLQEELQKKTVKENQRAVDQHNRKVVEEMMTSIIEGAFEKQAEVQRNTKG